MRHGQHQHNGAERRPLTPPAQNSSDTAAIPFAHRLTCTIHEACQATGLGRTKLYELIGAGYLDTTAVGRRRLARASSLQALLTTGAE